MIYVATSSYFAITRRGPNYNRVQPYKIGFSNNIQRRYDSMKTDCPGIRMVLIMIGELDDEHYLHDYFEGVRLEGEWFELSRNQVRQIPQIPDSSINRYARFLNEFA